MSAQIEGKTMNAGERNRIATGAGPGYVHVSVTNQIGSHFNLCDVELDIKAAEALLENLEAAIRVAKR